MDGRQRSKVYKIKNKATGLRRKDQKSRGATNQHRQLDHMLLPDELEVVIVLPSYWKGRDVPTEFLHKSTISQLYQSFRPNIFATGTGIPNQLHSDGLADPFYFNEMEAGNRCDATRPMLLIMCRNSQTAYLQSRYQLSFI